MKRFEWHFLLRLGSQGKWHHLLSPKLKPRCLHPTIIIRHHQADKHMPRHPHHLFFHFPQHPAHSPEAQIHPSVASPQPKEQASRVYNIRQNFSSLCVPAPVLLSLVKINRQINTWLTQVVLREDDGDGVYLQTLPGWEATFSADNSERLHYGNLLSIAIGTIVFFYCW